MGVTEISNPEDFSGSAAGADGAAVDLRGLVPAAPVELHADGVYFGLDETTYHRDPALGSTDIRRLFQSPAEWWWHSDFNPLRPADTRTRFKDFGSAVHKHVLEGEAAFHASYQREYDAPDLLDTVSDLKGWLAERNYKPHGKVKADFVQQILALDPTAMIKDEIERVAAQEGKIILGAGAYDRAVISGTMIAKNPDLETAFQGGMPEVSVFWTEEIDGEAVRCKARFDYLKARGIGDLKSTSNSKQIDFATVCRNAFAERRMDIQAAHYMRGRSFLAGHVEAGNVFGDHDSEWLAKVAAQDEYGFAIVFFQSDGAPSVWAASLSPGNPILETGQTHREAALIAFTYGLRTFGSGMWLRQDPIAEMDISDLPLWWGRR